MKILFVSALLPYPLYSGGQIRIYNLLKNVSAKHEITLLSFIRNVRERQYYKNLEFVPRLETVYRGKRLRLRYLAGAFFGRYPLLLASYDNKQMRDLIIREIRREKYDLIHIEPFYVYPSLPVTGLPLVVAEHNVEFEVYEKYARNVRIPLAQPILNFEAQRIKFWETKVLRKADRIIAVSDGDKAKLAEISGSKNITVVENGIDPEFFAFAEKTFSGKTKRFLFVGNFLWLPNLDLLDRLVKQIWPGIKAKLPDATLTIVGHNIPRQVQHQDLRSGIEFKGDVPDIRTEYAKADIMLAPVTIAGGSKYKILEAMAAGLAVITTKAGIDGLAVKPDQHLALSSGISDYADISADVYKNPGRWRTICRSARQFVEAKYGWAGIAPKLIQVWEKAAYEKK
jgi:polysaccharide biosynthesis protein PslH